MMIRQAEPADSPELTRIWLEASRKGHPFLGDEVLEEQLAMVRDVYLPHADNWVAEQSEVLGFIGLLGSHIGGLFVSPTAHRSGIGRELVEHAAGRLGTLTVEVYEQNGSALEFYRRCGFIPFGRKETDDDGRPFALLQLTRQA